MVKMIKSQGSRNLSFLWRRERRADDLDGHTQLSKANTVSVGWESAVMSSEKNLRRSEIQVSVGTTLPDTNVNAGSRGIWGEEPGDR